MTNQANQALKIQAAARALEYVQDGMWLGLGSGSTANCFIDLLGEKVQAGGFRHIRAVPTSVSTAQRAQSWGIQLFPLAHTNPGGIPHLDLAVDGADEVDPHLNLIKGLGRALLREKVVEIHAQQFIVIVDETKVVPRLGSRGPLPVEIVQFEAEVHVNWLNSLGCRAEQWFEQDGSPVVTDNGNFLVRCWFEGGIPDAYQLADQLASRPGIVEHGLFLDMTELAIVAGNQKVWTIEKQSR